MDRKRVCRQIQVSRRAAFRTYALRNERTVGKSIILVCHKGKVMK